MRLLVMAGSEGRDALSKLGLEERSILASEVLFNSTTADPFAPIELGGVFALKLNNAFSFSNSKEAEYIFEQLDSALNVIKSAHRSLTFDPISNFLPQKSLSIQVNPKSPETFFLLTSTLHVLTP